MGFEQRKQERQALVQHLLAQDWNVFGTLKFVNGRTIGRETADKLLRSYWNKVDRVIYGKAAERQNMRVPRWCFAHEGADHENFHVHFVMPSPLQDTEHMCCLLNAVWAQHHTGCGAAVGAFGPFLPFAHPRRCRSAARQTGHSLRVLNRGMIEPTVCGTFRTFAHATFANAESTHGRGVVFAVTRHVSPARSFSGLLA